MVVKIKPLLEKLKEAFQKLMTQSPTMRQTVRPFLRSGCRFLLSFRRSLTSVFRRLKLLMGNSAGATDEAFAKLDTTSNQAKIALNEVKNAGIDLGQTILQMVMPYSHSTSCQVLRMLRPSLLRNFPFVPRRHLILLHCPIEQLRLSP